MSQRKALARFGPRPSQPGQLREILREIARWAVASTLTASAGCAALTDPEMGQDVPGSAGTSASMGGGAGSGGTPMGMNGGGQTSSPGTAGSSAPTTPRPIEPTPRVPLPGTAGSAAPTEPMPMTPVEPTEWMALPCTSGGGYLDLATGLVLEPAADYAGLFRNHGVDPTTGMPIVDAYAQSGERCSEGSAGSDCVERFEKLRSSTPTCAADVDCATFLLTTRGDEVSRAAGPTEIRAALGAIDSATDAALVAFLDGQPMYCGNTLMPASEVRVEVEGFGVRIVRDECGDGLFRDTLHVAADGTITRVETEKVGPTTCAIGRRPEGLRAAAPERAASDRVGAYFAAAARLEAASVVAFDRLAGELEGHGAPVELVIAARLAALDEIRHTRSVAALAARFGAAFTLPSVEPMRARSRFAIALENAVEGCVRETYGALVAHHQALSARDPEVRAAISVIAEDESRHAELSWRIAGWLEPQLDQGERRALDAARSVALAELIAARDPELAPRERDALGMPSAEVAQGLLARLGVALGLG